MTSNRLKTIFKKLKGVNDIFKTGSKSCTKTTRNPERMAANYKANKSTRNLEGLTGTYHTFWNRLEKSKDGRKYAHPE